MSSDFGNITPAATAAGSAWGGPAGAAVGVSAAGLLNQAFSSGQGGNIRNQKDAIRVQQKYGEPNRRANSIWDFDNIYGKSIQKRVQDAKAAGLHPLFALGGQAASAQPAQQAIPGQSDSGSFKTAGLVNALLGKAELDQQKELTAMQLAASALRIAENNLGNDVAPTTPEKKHPQEVAAAGPLTEFKKGEVGAHDPKDRTKNLNVLSPMTTVRIGSQDVLVPVEEAADFMEDPMAAGLATYAYHGNKHVDWELLANEYLHGVRKRGIRKNAKPPPVIRHKASTYGLRGHGYRPKTWR